MAANDSATVSSWRRYGIVLCTECNWSSRRRPIPCEIGHVQPCDCLYGRCPKCGAVVMEAGRWKQVRAGAIALPVVPGARVREVPRAPAYCVSDTGRAWSRVLSGPNGIGNRWKELKPFERSGYFYISALRDGRRFDVGVHCLVLEAFVGPCPQGMEACHFPNPDRHDNRLCNLRWDTRAANSADARKQGVAPIGSRNGTSVLTEADIPVIRGLLAAGRSQGSVAREYGVHQYTIWAIACRKRWAHVP